MEVIKSRSGAVAVTKEEKKSVGEKTMSVREILARDYYFRLRAPSLTHSSFQDLPFVFQRARVLALVV